MLCWSVRQTAIMSFKFGFRDLESAGLRVVGRSFGERYRRRECNSAGQRAGGVRA